MDSIADIVNIACGGCSVVLSLISRTVSFSLNLSFFVGQLIVKFGVSVVCLLMDSVVALQTLIQVLTEDYIVFLSDFGSTLFFIYKSLSNSVETLVQSVVYGLENVGNILQSVQNFPYFIVVSFLDFVNLVFSSIFYILLLIKNSLVLVGATAWDLVVYFPSQGLSFKKNLVSFVLFCMANIRDALYSFRARLNKGFREAVVFVTDIPKESLYGLLVCLVLGYVSIKYHQNIRPVLIKSVLYLLNQSQKTLMAAWTYVEAFTLWLLTNQMTPSFNARRHRVAGAEPPVDDNIHTDVGHDNGDDEEREETQDDDLEHNERKLHQEQEDRLCVVCQDNEKCTIILPCRHVCLCYDCCVAIKRTNGLCPVCRHVMRRTMRVFI